MNVDFEPSTRYAPEEFLKWRVPYAFRDSCKDLLLELRVCHAVRHPLDLLNKRCRQAERRWRRCEEAREREIGELLGDAARQEKVQRLAAETSKP